MFQMLELYVVDNLLISEYVTRFGVHRFDIRPWKGEKELKLPVEKEDGTWEARVYEIQKLSKLRIIPEDYQQLLDDAPPPGLKEVQPIGGL